MLAGHDGTWAAHPGLVPLVLEVFDQKMPTPNQMHVLREDVHVTEADLLQMPTGTKSLEGLRLNTRVGIQVSHTGAARVQAASKRQASGCVGGGKHSSRVFHVSHWGCPC